MGIFFLLRKSATEYGRDTQGGEYARSETSGVHLFWSFPSGNLVARVDVASSIGESFSRTPVRSDLTSSDGSALVIAQMISQHDEAIRVEEWQRTQKYAMHEGEYGSSATNP